MEIGFTTREVVTRQRYVTTPYGEFAFPMVIEMLDRLALSTKERPNFLIGDDNFARLVKGEAIGAKVGSCWYGTNHTRIDALIYDFRMASCLSREAS